ncbi:HlyD family type I secretion periplasmic adaptor subunit [Azospirillum halopraeferens]|uniref:HlyD family type I secretion periplasmic adaptor subunit n=1 Tax=Azospirillum halopraeferens TaxID=34010 RepID=UPI00042614A9|nr:HlyD family type I secretion periplasmic adaptor subunit [Azospirillum halopraeferens]
MAKQHSEQTIIDFQSETSEIIGGSDPLAARLTVWLLACLLIGLLSLASIAKLERVVVARGQVVSQSAALSLQPLETSIVRDIRVKEGQVVRKGELLASLDPTFSAADMAQFERKRRSLAAEIDRLQMELQDKPYRMVEGNPDTRLQAAIWQARQSEFHSRMMSLRQKQDVARASLQQSRDDVVHYKRRLQLLSAVADMRQELEQNKVGSRLNSLLASDARVEASRNLAAAESSVLTATHDLEALKAEEDVYIQQRQSQIIKELADKQVEFDRINEELTKATRRHDLVEMRAAEDAVVLDVAPLSVGSIVQTADKIMTLVPMNTALQIEANIDARDQGFVKPGDVVQLKFDAYRYVEHGMGRGVVSTISEDSFTQKDGVRSSEPFYRARVDLREVSLRNVPDDFRLVPGMPVTADIVVGTRTIISYLVEKAMVSVQEGLREP